MRQIGDKVSYVRNPFARNSYYCLTLAVLGLALGTASMYLSVARAGQGGLNTGAYGFSSLAAALWGCGTVCAHLWKGPQLHTGENRNQYLRGAGHRVGCDYHNRYCKIDGSKCRWITESYYRKRMMP